MTPARVAGPDDAATVTRILADAFANDPLWGDQVAAVDRGWRTAVFGLLVAAALPQSWVWLGADDAAAALWLPPDGADLTSEQEQEFDSLLTTALEPDAAERLLRALELIEQARPTRPHFYLSLLGTDPASTGHGHAQRLLAINLQLVDDADAPAYLECADGLVRVYERFGFERVGGFALPVGGRTNSMWRAPRSEASATR
jgi:GNAT superfamily N-acetyltransferase